MRKRIKMLILKCKWRKKQIVFSMDCNISMNTEFEGCNKIGKGSDFTGKIGYGSYMGKECKINALIGRYCSIAPHVHVIAGSHPVSEFVSTNPAFYSLNKPAGLTYVDENLYTEHSYAKSKYLVEIGNDVWIGYGAKIMQGVHIGDGAVIGAGALVTKDVAPYTIVGGVPAKIIRKRFDDETIEKLLKIQWWNKDKEWIKENALLFSNVEKFVESEGQ